MTQAQSPAEFDAHELVLMNDLAGAERTLGAVLGHVHRMAGDTKARPGRGSVPYWQLSDEEAALALTAMTANGDEYDYQARCRPSEALARLAQLAEHAASLRDAISKMERVYRENPWTRWYPCLNRDGHIHSDDRACPTLHRDGNMTDMGWETSLSGQPVAVVIEALGPRLCSVCFPGAPAEHCLSLSEITRAERQAARAEKAAAKAARTAVKELDVPFTASDGDKVKTVSEAKRLVREAAETAVELDWHRSDDGRSKWKGMEERYPEFLLRVERRLARRQADAVKLNNILVEREILVPGSGWTWADSDKAVAAAVKRARKAYFG
jgi:hypothetical protein